jgi:putative transposase
LTRLKQSRGVWQRRFWEHTLRDECDYTRHFDYLHFNPVKYGLVNSPLAWPYSSVHRWVEHGIYDRNWGCVAPDPTGFEDLGGGR